MQPLDFTYVMYDPADPVSETMAFLTFLPQVIVIVVVCAILFRRELESIFLLSGILANEVLNIVLKRWFAEPRPIGSAKAGFGLPSSHSQLMFFVVVFIAMWLYCSQRVTLDHHLHKHLLVALLVGSSVIVAFSRVYLGVHSTKQVVVGGVVGSVVGVVWHYLGHHLARPKLYPLVEESRVGAVFLLRDSAGVSNVMRAEYHAHRTLLRSADGAGAVRVGIRNPKERTQ